MFDLGKREKTEKERRRGRAGIIYIFIYVQELLLFGDPQNYPRYILRHSYNNKKYV
jgi:hypothetical protein